MDMLKLVPSEAALPRFGVDFGASDFCCKELRIKDLHKNLCKKRSRHNWGRVFTMGGCRRGREQVSDRTTPATVPVESHGRQHYLTAEGPIVDSEASQNEGMAFLPLRVRPLRPWESQDPPKRTGKRETQLPSKYCDDESSHPVLFSEKHSKPSPNSGAPVPKAKRPRLPPIVPHRSRPHFFEVPISSFDPDDSVLHGVADHSPSPFKEWLSPSRPSPKLSDLSPSSTSQRGSTPRCFKDIIDDSVYMEEVSSDSEPREWRSMKKNKSTDASTDKVVPAGPKGRTVESMLKLSRTSPEATKGKSVSMKGTAVERKVKQNE